MRTLAVLLFGFLHSMYCKVYKEPEYARFFAASIISFIAVIVIAVLLTYLLFEINPLWSFEFYTYYKYFGIGVLLSSWWFINPITREQSYLKIYHGFGKRKRLGFLTAIAVLVFVFFYLYFAMGDKLRALELPL